ncbi:hypothetical protein [Pseudomonas sp. LT1P18]|uniref:hypothetical protein n=1 Tax=Pseudomonas arabinosi TaxID=3398357 RepID=UPI0039EE1E08
MNIESKSVPQDKPGELDPAFGVGGVVNAPSGSGSIRCIVEDVQGAIVYAVWVSNECWLYRVFSDGAPDHQFGLGGVTKWAFAPGMVSAPVQLIRQPDGKFLLIGAVRAVDDVEKPRVAIARFNTNGSPDLIFGNRILPFPTTGKFYTLFPTDGCLQADGKILIAAPYTMLDSNDNIVYEATVLHRLQDNGEADLEFGGGRGFIDVRLNGQDTKGESVAIMSGERILLGGTVQRIDSDGIHRKQSIARFLPNGALDPAFGTSGYWEAEGDNVMGKLIVHEDLIICVGYEGPKSFLACLSRLTPNGSFDPTFNNGSRLLVDIKADVPGLHVTCTSVALQSDGKIVAAGHAGRNAQSYWLRVGSRGELDPVFGDHGVFIYEPSKHMGGLIVQGDSQRIVTGIDSATAPKPKMLGILS